MPAGSQAEEKAAGLLVGALGFEVLARRVRTKAGEVDLIARLRATCWSSAR